MHFSDLASNLMFPMNEKTPFQKECASSEQHPWRPVGCSCSVLRSRCRVLQKVLLVWVAVSCSVLQQAHMSSAPHSGRPVGCCCIALQSCCSVLQSCCSVLQSSCRFSQSDRSALQCSCSVLQKSMHTCFTYFKRFPYYSKVMLQWRRPTGCLKMQVIFRKKATNNRALLRKTTFKKKHRMGLCHSVRCVILVTRHIYMWHYSFSCVMWRIHICDMIHSCVRHDTSICLTWLIHMCDRTHPYIWGIKIICDMTHSYVTQLIHSWHDAFICVTWRIHIWHVAFVCDMTHSYVTRRIHMWHDSFICDMTHSYVTWLNYMWHDSFTRNISRSHVTCICVYVTWLTHMWHDSITCDMTHLHATFLVHMTYSPQWGHRDARVKRQNNLFSITCDNHTWHD